MLKNIMTFLVTVSIPLMLFACVWQSNRYLQIQSELKTQEQYQYEIIKENKRIISAISVLASPERIEKVAKNELAMRKALPHEIVRIELKKGGLGG